MQLSLAIENLYNCLNKMQCITRKRTDFVLFQTKKLWAMISALLTLFSSGAGFHKNIDCICLATDVGQFGNFVYKCSAYLGRGQTCFISNLGEVDQMPGIQAAFSMSRLIFGGI